MGQRSQCLPAKAVPSQGKPAAVDLQCFQCLKLSAIPKDHGATCLSHDLKQNCHWGGGSGEERYSRDSPRPGPDLQHHLSPRVNSRIYFNPSAGLDPSTLCPQYMLLTNQQGVLLQCPWSTGLCCALQNPPHCLTQQGSSLSRDKQGAACCILHCRTRGPATAQQLSLLL